MTLKMMSVNLFDRVPRHAQKMGSVFEGHPHQKINHIPCKATSVAVTARGKGYPLLTIIITIHTLALVAADFHPQNHLFASDRKADKVASAKTILHQMGMSVLGTAFRSLFTFYMKSRYLSKGLDYEVTIKKRPNYCTDIALLSRL